MIIYNSRGIKKNVTLQTYYNLDGMYILFDGNELHNKSYANVDVKIRQVKRSISGITFVEHLIEIGEQEPIDCEFIDLYEHNNNLIIKLCQDWG